MDLPENLSNTLRRVFDDGLDEVLVFAFIFLFILLTSREDDNPGKESRSLGILPVILIGVLLLLYSGLSRTENLPE